MTLVYLSLSWLAGVYLGSWMSLPVVLFILGGVLVLGVVFIRRRATVMAALCLALLVGGAARYQAGIPAEDEGPLLRSFNGQKVEVTGLVVDSPAARDRFLRLRVEAREVSTKKDGPQPVSGSAVVWAPRSSPIKYGDVLQLKGDMEAPPVFGDFDYRHYLEQQGVHSFLAFPEVKVLERGRGSVFLSWLHSARERLSRSLATFLPEPQASLAQAVLLGEQGNIPDTVRGQFTRSGTAHILVVSGQNVSIAAGLLLVLGAWFFGRRRYVHIWFSLTAVWVYALLVGGNPPVVRAAIMASVFLFADLAGRQRSGLVALTLAAVVMVGIEPGLLWQVSFQLSFLATLGMVLVAPPLQALGRRAVERLVGESGVAASLAGLAVDAGAISTGAIVMTWPVVSHSFGLVSLVGLPATLLVSPALAGIILASVATGLLGLFAPVLAHVAAWVDWLFLTYMHRVAEAFSLLPMASVEVRLNSGLVLGYYLLIAVAWLGARVAWRRVPRPAGDREQSRAPVSVGWSAKVALPSFLAVTVLVWVAALSGPREQWRVSFLDVGQGTAILVQSPGRDILIDGGPSPQKLNLELGRQLPFWDRKIELVVATQPHADHLAGLVGLLERYDVGEVLEPEVPYDSLLYQEWRRMLDERGIRRTRAEAGQEVRLGVGARIEVLNPQTDFLRGKNGEVEVDDNGVVLRLVVGEVSFLFPADVTVEGEREMIFRRVLSQSDVLGVAHHGSSTSTSEGFLAVVRPRVAVISSGAGNRFGHPDEEIVERLKGSTVADRIYLTRERGTVEITTDGRRLWVRTAR